jgi:hypothetical protein
VKLPTAAESNVKCSFYYTSTLFIFNNVFLSFDFIGVCGESIVWGVLLETYINSSELDESEVFDVEDYRILEKISSLSLLFPVSLPKYYVEFLLV